MFVFCTYVILIWVFLAVGQRIIRHVVLVEGERGVSFTHQMVTRNKFTFPYILCRAFSDLVRKGRVADLRVFRIHI